MFPCARQATVLGAPRQISSVHARVLAVPGGRDQRTARHQGVLLKGRGGDGLARDIHRDDIAGARPGNADLLNDVHVVGGCPIIGIQLPHREPGRVQVRHQVQIMQNHHRSARRAVRVCPRERDLKSVLDLILARQRRCSPRAR